MKKLVAATPRLRGRPRVGDCKIVCVVPQQVADLLRAKEKATGVYRTRVAANVLCQWASRTIGRSVVPYDLRSAERGPL